MHLNSPIETPLGTYILSGLLITDSKTVSADGHFEISYKLYKIALFCVRATADRRRERRVEIALLHREQTSSVRWSSGSALGYRF